MQKNALFKRAFSLHGWHIARRKCTPRYLPSLRTYQYYCQTDREISSQDEERETRFHFAPSLRLSPCRFAVSSLPFSIGAKGGNHDGPVAGSTS